ncbi:MAG: glutamine--fructose-6-phosphate transaminase (isomerizing) [Candidatus Margulisiibacteriota bacterium]|nr:MAG: glutamine--fructose-6-phosphate aminotransferase [Candidatus Margulisbacteria bacterium GWD2_39_127]OGI05168.1 MAG: glutamine--fructose-6-phosphate aminotransferase [Candidatus Margulisbacteria bacterium GWF2_38_17]OGI06217.1 MAG: glutamine--fructose-6-phosphate aminotransferase [Candidatus Margulisbacteria bacterium GWE2_39_32]PZM78874.1 MAG: glutamine--fructose-6-phosphate transaminase (isomerizing) [Candidatus Margulisiibacteriota bacterium]HAR64546.1 glutamine--fructose-6-phosphate 
MCGIFGYLGSKDCVDMIIDGLKKLEYRGYDSSGITTLHEGKLNVTKCVGKIVELEKVISTSTMQGCIGLGHTRWATHGETTHDNSHPHTDCSGEIVLVHNGIIENYSLLKSKLIAKGHIFRSDTDTEVLAHLIEESFQGNLEEAVLESLKQVEGTYAIGVIAKKDPNKIVVAKNASPLIIGCGKNEYFITSDISAILKYNRDVIYLEDKEIAIISPEGIVVKDIKGKTLVKEIVTVMMDASTAEKEGYPHFMAKEIHEQPRAVMETFAGRSFMREGMINLSGINLEKKELTKFNRVVITACGTSLHAGLVGEFMIEKFAHIPVEVEYAAEFRYRNPIIDNKTLVIAISQSGETADTIAAIKEAKLKGAKVLSVCNVMNSTVARESDGVIYTRAGLEIGVASTKAFTTQIVLLYLLSIFLGEIRYILSKDEVKSLLKELDLLPRKIEKVFKNEHKIMKICKKFYTTRNFLYLGRGIGFPVALEGALKLKEISYIHAEGYSAAEMKHGPIALIDEYMPVVVIALKGRSYEKIMGNIEEVKARRGVVIAIATEGDKHIAEKVNEVVYIPDTIEELSSILSVIPLQILAYHIAVMRGCNVDQPRNLAKSVTVE